MEITGKIIAVLPQRTGTSTRTGSEWVLGSYVLETIEQYSRKMNFEVFGADRIQQFNIQVGEVMTVSFDIDAREYKRADGTVTWFNSIRAWKVDRNVQPQAGAPQGAVVDPANIPPFGAPQAAPQAAAPSPAEAPAFPPLQRNATDELPF